MYGNFSKANMDTQTSSHMLLKNNSTEALNQILFPPREREIFEHLVFYYILLYCGLHACVSFGTYQNFKILLKIFATLPISTASSERSFSIV